MAAYEILLLNTAIPQIQAAQAGDTYVVPRDIAINATAIISANSATDALRITQTGAGNAILVEDSANPDSSPFVVTGAGDVGIGTASPGQKLEVNGIAQVKINSANAAEFHIVNTSASARDWVLLSTGSSWAGGGQTGYFNIYDNTAGAQRLTIDTSGNLGLGVTPSAWSGVSGNVFEIKGNAYIYSTTGVLSSGANAFFNGTNWIYKTTQAATRYEQVNGQHQWGIAPSGTAGNAITFTQAMTLDASGRLMIGPTSTTYRLDVDSGAANTAIFRSTGGNPQITATDGTVTQFSGYTGGGVAYAGTSSNHPFAVLTNNTERARITSGGDLLVGGHSAAVFGEKFSLVAGAQNGALFKNTAQPSNVALFWNASTTGDAQFCAFATETSYTSRGTISYNRAGGLVAYNTTSDYRAKDIIGPITNSGATIDALKVYEGVMKGATQSRPMLVAHEAQAVAPYAVTGEKDAVNEDGDPIYQQMDVSSLVPLLLAEIQSLRARVAALEAN